MDLKQIRYFVAVAEAGSFSAGARRAFVTQPTLSTAISALEAELGFALLERHARGVRLTAKGEGALVTAHSILRQTEQLKAASRDKPAGKPLRLGILPTLAPAFVTGCLSRLIAIDSDKSWRTEDARWQSLPAVGQWPLRLILTALVHRRVAAGKRNC
jgi:LysR family hydrogen peroxide-inducible transcriptional activator